MGVKNEDGIRGLQEQAILEAEDRKMDIGYALYRDHCARNQPKVNYPRLKPGACLPKRLLGGLTAPHCPGGQ